MVESISDNLGLVAIFALTLMQILTQEYWEHAKCIANVVENWMNKNRNASVLAPF